MFSGCLLEPKSKWKTTNLKDHDLNLPIEAKTSHDNLDSIGGYKSHYHCSFTF